MTRRKYGDYDQHDCGCGSKGAKHDDHHKNDDKLDDIIDLLKKLLKKKDNVNGNGDSCDAITIKFNDNTLLVSEFVSSGGTFNCTITPGTTNIAEATACLYSRGFKIVAFTALNNEHTYTFVRC